MTHQIPNLFQTFYKPKENVNIKLLDLYESLIVYILLSNMPMSPHDIGYKPT